MTSTSSTIAPFPSVRAALAAAMLIAASLAVPAAAQDQTSTTQSAGEEAGPAADAAAPARSETAQAPAEPLTPAAPAAEPDAPAAGAAAPAAEAETAPSASEMAPAGEAQADAVEAEAPAVETMSVGEAAEPVAERNAALPHDLSPWGMFIAADWVVKAVMIGLAFASLVTWTVWLAKSLELAGAKARLSSALDKIVAARNLDEAGEALQRGKGPAALMVRAADHERTMSQESIDYGGADGLKERVTSHLSRIEAEAQRRISRGTGLLATIGSTAPFVGLFGTVWGIMNAFIGISQAQTTNLAIVAPGIAEALFATAIGLVAAIPAVVIYNFFARSIAGYRLLLGHVSAAVERLVSRDLDQTRISAHHGLARAAE